MPDVSVVIPTRNRPELTPRAVLSALQQTSVDIEVIVVDDGSSDDTPERVEAIEDERIRLVRLGKGQGACHARNVGIDLASAPFIAFLDSDDTWVPDKLERQLAVAQAGVVVATRAMRFRDHESFDVIPDLLPTGDSISEYLFARRGLLLTSTLLVPMELARAVRFDPALPRHHDYDFCLRLEAAGAGFTMLAAPLVFWHVGRDRPRISTSGDVDASLTWFSSASENWSGAARSGFEVREILPRLSWRGRDRLLGLRIVARGLLYRSLRLHQAVRWAASLLLRMRRASGEEFGEPVDLRDQERT